MIKEITNPVDLIFLNRIKKTLFMLYPFADYRVSLVKMEGDSKIETRLYLHFSESKSCLNSLIPLEGEELFKMALDRYYTPFSTEKYKSAFEDFQKIVKSINDWRWQSQRLRLMVGVESCN